MTNLKIGILGTRGIPNQYGGFEQFAEMLATNLSNRGHEVFVYCSDLHPYKETLWNGVQLIHCNDPERKLGTAGQFIYDRNCLLDARKKNFHILLHLGYTSDSVWHHLWPKNTVNIMNMDGLEWKRKKYNWFTRRFLHRAERLAVKYADVLVADSSVIKQYLAQHYQKEAHYIAYSAEAFSAPDTQRLVSFPIEPFRYYHTVARMEPENNFEMIIEGYLASGISMPLLITGNTNNGYGKRLSRKYRQPGIVFTGPIYDKAIINNLRYHSLCYFHGHSVGGTNPSLLEAMGCGCNIIAHGNDFNRSVLENNADYFLSAEDVTAVLLRQPDEETRQLRRLNNLTKIKADFSPEQITDAYEELMLHYFANSRQSGS